MYNDLTLGLRSLGSCDKSTNNWFGSFRVQLQLHLHLLVSVAEPLDFLKLLQQPHKRVLYLQLTEVPPKTNPGSYVEREVLGRLGRP